MKSLLHCGSGTPNRRTNSKWPNNSLMWPTTVLSLFFPCRNFCAENFVIFFYEIMLLFTSTFLLAIVKLLLVMFLLEGVFQDGGSWSVVRSVKTVGKLICLVSR